MGSGSPWEVTWTVPIEHSASFQISTNNEDRQVPSAPLWFQYRDTCEEFTAAGEVEELNHLLASKELPGDGPVKEVDLSLDRSMIAGIDLASYDDGSVSTKRANITPMPTEFWIRMPEESLDATFKSSEYISEFEYITNGCRLVNLNGVEPETDPVRIASLTNPFETAEPEEAAAEQFGRIGYCKPGEVASRIGSFILENTKRVGSAIMKVSDGSEWALDAIWEGVKSDLSFLMDLDGYSDQRDRPRFSRVDANVRSFDISANNEDDGTGEDWEWDKGRIDINTQPQWYEDSGSSSSGEVRGAIEVPEWMTDKQCLERNATGVCIDRESWDQVQQRVAENHLEDSFLYKEDHQSEETVPARKWAEAVR